MGALWLLVLGSLCVVALVVHMVHLNRRLRMRTNVDFVGPWVFEYEEKWREQVTACPLCTWFGSLGDAAPAEESDFIAIYCPRCLKEHGSKLALVSYPAEGGDRN